jgi:hypothetical protein
MRFFKIEKFQNSKHLKSVTVFFARTFGLTSPSAWCDAKTAYLGLLTDQAHCAAVENAEFLNQNLITNCTSLRHLGAFKCMTASISDKQGKSGRITDKQILNLEKNTHHYLKGALVGQRAELLEKRLRLLIATLQWQLYFSDKRYKNKSFLNIFHKILRKMVITTEVSAKGQLAAISWVTSDRKKCQTGFF